MNIRDEIIIASAIERAAKAISKGSAVYQTPDRLLTVTDIAARLRVGKNTANMLVQKGVIKSLNLGGKKVRERELESWLERMEGFDLSDPFHPVPMEVKGAKA